MRNPYNKYERGFTLLELLAVLAIMAVASLFALPSFQEWNAKRSFDKVTNEIYSELSQARMQSLQRGTTTKVVTSASNDTYTLTVYYNSAATTCNDNNNWTSLETLNTTINTSFQITGSGIGTICFFRDGTSSGGIFNITQKNGQTNLGSGTINVVLATGFVDVTKN